jgi:hypothetical protein
MKYLFTKKSALTMLTMSLSFSNPTMAEEGATGHYAIGGMATMADLAPTDAGWIVQPLYLNYQGDGGGEQPLSLGGNIALDVKAKVNAFILGGIYTFENPVLGAFFSMGTYLPYVDMDITATLAIDTLGSTTQRDVATGLGDITLIPLMMAWKSDFWQYSAVLPVYAPTGDYEVGRLANQGLNYWTIDPSLSASYNNPETGFNFAINGGITFNSENSDTNYKSGSALHVEVSVQQLLPLGSGFFGIGLNAFIYEQVSGDSGEGAVLGDFKGESLGIGPVLSYILPTKNSGTGFIEFRWLPELSTDQRIEGDYIWLKGGWQF